jgi:cell division protein FtsQ
VQGDYFPNHGLMPRESLTREDEKLFRPRSGAPPDAVESDDFPRLLDLEPEQESPFLRGQKRVPVRRGPLAKKTANRLKHALVALAAVGLLAIVASVLYQYGEHSWRFRIRSGDNIEIAGTQNVARRHVLQAFGADLGRNIFFVPLTDRRSQLEAIPWVESATVMRLLPDRLRVDVTERNPVAFARVGSRISVVDRNGVIMEMPAARARRYSFPVIKGMSESEPLSTRAARMQIYSGLMRELDSEGAHYSQDISEVDLADPEDVKVVAADPAGAVLVHLGSSDFLRRYKIYIAHVAQWRQQFQKLDSVDLRYERQIIVNPDSAPPKPAARPQSLPHQKPATKTVAQAATPKTPVAHKPSPRTKNDSGTH